MSSRRRKRNRSFSWTQNSQTAANNPNNNADDTLMQYQPLGEYRKKSNTTQPHSSTTSTNKRNHPYLASAFQNHSQKSREALGPLKEMSQKLAHETIPNLIEKRLKRTRGNQVTPVSQTSPDLQQTDVNNVPEEKNERALHETKTKISEQNVPNNDLQEAIVLHDKGVAGDKSAVQKAYDILEKQYEVQRDNERVRAYFGSTKALMGRDEEHPSKRIQYVLSGLKLLDQVVEESPELIEVRLLRGNICGSLPEMYFNRTETAIEDFRYLIERYNENENTLTAEQYESVLKNIIEAFETLNRREEAEPYRKAFQEVRKNKNEDEVDANDASDYVDQRSFEIYQQALNGDEKAINKAIDHFSSLEIEKPNNPYVKAIAIDSKSLLGKNASNSFEMFSTGIKAMKELNELVQEHPDNLNVRKIRAMQSFRLPEAFFRKTASAIKDFEDLIRAYDKNTSLFTKEEYEQILLHLAQGYDRLDMKEEANAVWEKLASTNPNKEVKELLKQRNELLSFKPYNLDALRTDQPKELFKVGKELHVVGSKGSKEAAQQALDVWERAYEAYPDDPTAKTYYAASLALMAKYADEPQGLFGNTIKGMKLLKEAFDTSNESAELLKLRGMIYYVLPDGFFQTRDKAIKDFKNAATRFEDGDTSISNQEYLQVLAKLAEAYASSNQHDKAEKTWTKLASQDSEGQYRDLLIGKGVVTE